MKEAIGRQSWVPETWKRRQTESSVSPGFLHCEFVLIINGFPRKLEFFGFLKEFLPLILTCSGAENWPEIIKPLGSCYKPGRATPSYDIMPSSLNG